MILSREAITSFRDLHERKFGVTLSDDEAKKVASDLLNLMNLVYQKIPKEHEHILESFKNK